MPSFADLFNAINDLRKEIEAWRSETVTHNELNLVVKASEDDRHRLASRIATVEDDLKDKVDCREHKRVEDELDANTKLTLQMRGMGILVAATFPFVAACVTLIIQRLLSGHW